MPLRLEEGEQLSLLLNKPLIVNTNFRRVLVLQTCQNLVTTERSKICRGWWLGAS